MGRRGEALAHTPGNLASLLLMAAVSFDLGNKISKLILSQIIAYLNALHMSDLGFASNEVAVFVEMG